MSEDQQADAALTYEPVGVTLVHEHRVLVRCPYNTSFIPRAKALRGQWDPNNMLWIFPGENAERVRWLCESWFGTDGSSSPDLVDVDLTFPEAYSQGAQEATIFGRVIANTRGRAAAIRGGEGVAFIEGHAFSEASGLGRRTVVAAGSRIRMMAVPRRLAEEHAPPGVQVSLIERLTPAAAPRSAPAPSGNDRGGGSQPAWNRDSGSGAPRRRQRGGGRSPGAGRSAATNRCR